MACSSCTKSSVSIDLFNLPPLPDTRKHSTMICEIPNNFFVPDGKNIQLSKVVNTWTFDRLTPNGNEGVGVQLDYLEHTYGTRYYVIDKVNSDINAIHDQSLELTEFKGRFSPFDLDDLEARVCRLANWSWRCRGRCWATEHPMHMLHGSENTEYGSIRRYGVRRKQLQPDTDSQWRIIKENHSTTHINTKTWRWTYPEQVRPNWQQG